IMEAGSPPASRLVRPSVSPPARQRQPRAPIIPRPITAPPVMTAHHPITPSPIEGSKAKQNISSPLRKADVDIRAYRYGRIDRTNRRLSFFSSAWSGFGCADLIPHDMQSLLVPRFQHTEIVGF